MTRRLVCSIASTILLGSAACRTSVPTADGPLKQKWRLKQADGRAGGLVVFLPGRGDRPQDLVKADLAESLHKAGADVDCVIVDAHLGYYLNHSVIDRLYEEVLLPARRAGYRRITLVGFSLGAVGSLFALRDHPQYVDHVVLLGPFAGEDGRVLSAVASGKSVAKLPDGPEFERELWRFVQSPTHAGKVWMGAGTSDRLGRGQRLLAEHLPTGHVRFIRGGHDWSTWRRLWRDWACRLPAFQ
jgi:pimeloyl-ACP methyl ester carboxylesterase